MIRSDILAVPRPSLLQSPDAMVRLLQSARLGSVPAVRQLMPLQAATILESSPGSRFDDFSFLAARTLRVPIAGISLVDGPHHWLRTTEGFGLSRRRPADPFCETLRERPDAALLVKDASTDAVLSRSRLVASTPFLRAYVGIALQDDTGRFLGTVFAGDTAPRAFSSNDVAALRALGAGLETVLALHSSVVELFHAVTSDFLTGLLNRAPFEIKVAEAAAQAAPGSGCALICLDVDHFKHINDRFGHATGDAVLLETATRLARSLRRSDCAARLSGDEFAVLMTAPATADDAVALMRRILTAFEHPLELGGQLIDIRISLGAALLPDDADDVAQLLQRADVALYQAKRRGGSGCTLYDPHAEMELLRQRDLRHDLAAALERGELRLAWQPMVSAREGALRGYEALLRWERPQHGLTMPNEFIPLAETSGQIVDLDAWVIGQACEEAMSLPGDIAIAVNVWPGWFGRGTLAGVIRAALEQSGLAAARLEIEVTERALIRNGEATHDEMVQIKSLGVRLSLDDFGVGFSSLHCLSTYPFDGLKLDAAFVRDLCVNDRSRRIALHVLQLGHELGMQVCAEGVETERQRAILQEDGYDLLQGYLVGRPAVPLAEAAADPRSIRPRGDDRTPTAGRDGTAARPRQRDAATELLNQEVQSRNKAAVHLSQFSE